MKLEEVATRAHNRVVSLARNMHRLAPVQSAGSERRLGMSPIPQDLSLYLNPEQCGALETLSYFGWQLAFVRRSDLARILAVVQHRASGEFAVLDSEGDLIRKPDIVLRSA
jgi:hypothetical protein